MSFILCLFISFTLFYSILAGNPRSFNSSIGKCPNSLEVLEGAGGILTSPQYGSRYGYPNDVRCFWKVVVPNNKVVKLEVVRLSVEPSPGCQFDRVEVRNGQSYKSPLLATFCSPFLAGWKGISSSNVVLVTFISDGSLRFPGFLIKYTAVDPEIPTAKNETILNPNGGCGKPDVKPLMNHLRIVGGRQAKPHSWPWQVGIRLKPEQQFFSCGGSIIRPTWILTAAHCMLNKRGKLLSRWRMRIYVGTHHLLLRTNTESVHRVKRLIPHPNFQHTSKGYDIGLIEIKPPVKFSSTAKPICLPSSDKEASTRDTCFATGWGLTKGTGSMTVLNQAQIPILEDNVCSSPWIYGYHYKEDMICGGHLRGGKDTCGGDSGGPLSCLAGDIWYLQGITSWGLGCGRKRFPGVYTKTAYYLSWIRNFVKDA